MEIFKPGRLEILLMKVFVLIYNLLCLKQTFSIIKDNRKFHSEARMIFRAERVGKAYPDMLEQAHWAQISARRLFSSGDSVLSLLRKKLSHLPETEKNVYMKNRIRRFKEGINLLIRIDRQKITPHLASSETTELDNTINDTINRILDRKIAAKDLVYDFKPAFCHRIDLLVSKPGENPFFNKLIPDLLSAKSHIHIIMYGFRDTRGMPDSTAARIAKILCEKAQQGVEVNLLLDGIGSGLFGFRQNENCRRLILRMIESGIRCVFNNPWNVQDEERLFHLDHRKQYVIDGMIAYVGGMGIEDQFDNTSAEKNCHDVMIRLEGEIVHQFQCSFLSSFTYQYIKNNKIKRFPLKLDHDHLKCKYFPKMDRQSGSIQATLLQNIPVVNTHQVTKKYHQLIQDAIKQIYFMNPYCSEDSFVRTLKRWTKAGAKRKVSAHAALTADKKESLLLLPGEILNGFIGLFKRFELPGLILAGVKIALYQRGFLHGKVVVQDRKRFMIGSCNLDAFSMWRNWESAIYIEDSSLAEELLGKIFDGKENKDNFEILSSKYNVTRWQKVVCRVIDWIDRFF